jgi:transcriptional regulator with XRE-family HTH domain
MPDTALMQDLGRELRRGRLAAGYRSQASLASALQIDRTAVSRAESGKRIPTTAILKKWSDLCGLDHGRIATMARGARGSFPEWFEGWRDDVEAISARLAYWDAVIMPAVARTDAYIRAVLGAGGVAPTDEHVAAQLARATVLERAEVVMIVHEMALRRFVGSPVVMSEQLRHLASIAEAPSAHVHVVPNSEDCPGMSGAFSMSHDLGVIHMDGIRGRTTSDPDVFKAATVLFERIRAHALPRGASRDLIEKVAEQWTKQAG